MPDLLHDLPLVAAPGARHRYENRHPLPKGTPDMRGLANIRLLNEGREKTPEPMPVDEAADLNRLWAANNRNAALDRAKVNQRDERAELRGAIMAAVTAVAAVNRLQARAEIEGDAFDVDVWRRRHTELDAELNALLDRAFA